MSSGRLIWNLIFTVHTHSEQKLTINMLIIRYNRQIEDDKNILNKERCLNVATNFEKTIYSLIRI